MLVFRKGAILRASELMASNEVIFDLSHSDKGPLLTRLHFHLMPQA